MYSRMETPAKQQPVKVLVLTGSIGHGHIQTANAIRDTAARRFGRQVDVQIVDYLEQVAPHLHGVGSYCFIQFLKMLPSMYGMAFEMTRKDRMLAQMIKRVRFTSLKPLTKLIQDSKPDVIVSTFPAASAAVSKLKEKGVVSVPSITVITDHTDHSFWLYPYTDLYMVGSDNARRMLIAQGIDPKSIEVTGIPVRPPFYETYDKVALREKHGLSQDKMTVLLMGGGCGLMDPSMLENLEYSVPELTEKTQFIIVCGSNEKLRHQLDAWSATTSLSIHVKGYVQDIHELMALSDVMITKSGGVTTAEAMALQLPLIVYKPLPGQEQDNIRYLVHNGLAQCAHNAAHLTYILSELAEHPSLLEKMSERAAEERSKMKGDALALMLELRDQPVHTPVLMKKWLRRTV
ncbi:MGDG synthase family glycosyltransferase [Paenibacillus sp. 1001270B_150601_E10]|uniref:MGDG synthase family glycosyltransferase n=1 Tax=Paenibacillus sp. 1001270B_150601_E10 TaxID=2787079 RepID=UPI00189F5CC7|nr:glycosyltransferase [Paenibacillus sp. 1001270B_150601_E10]